MIRSAGPEDISRIAEMLVFNKRLNYRDIFRDDSFSFNTLQVISTVREYMQYLDDIYVYEEDDIVRGMMRVQEDQVRELYVDPFFQSRGIGGQLLDFATDEAGADWLWVLEKNYRAVAFYECHGFCRTSEKTLVTGTSQYMIKMQRKGCK